MIRLRCYLLTLLCFSALAVAGRRPRFEPLPECSECVPCADILASGIGFDLTVSYGTAAIRHFNGSIENLGKVDATKAYTELMGRLSNAPPKLSCSKSNWDEVRCSWSRARRRLNKMRGLPATPDVGIIANLILQLRETVENRLGQDSAKRVLPAVPRLRGLPSEDLQDAMEYAGVIAISTHKHIGDFVSETSAAFAGMGYGLCNHYDNVDTCEDEEADMSISYILALSFSHASFGAAYTYMQSAFRSIHEKDALHFDLGLGNLPATDHDKRFYWNSIRDTIVSVGRASPRPLTHLLLLGEDANNPDFIEVVQEALRQLLPGNSRSIRTLSSERPLDTLDPLYVAARGAAEFAKRALESPAGCREPPRCAESRLPPKSYGKDQQVLNEEL